MTMPSEALVDQLAKAYRLAQVALSLAFVFAAVIALAAALWVRHQRAEGDRVLACYVGESLDRGQKTLPTLGYYKEHPQELQDALDSIKEQKQRAVDAWGHCHQ